ncbi:DUF3887 domain-containing protein [Luteimonas kalidii]|uniref:DUF3887 domain-containing protein n=1 Tax=Luteimonas kalidii TaxID=3042025 RepID=A0ABT6JY96_9GAMM|nr:DUF3887 domain-containing protein [Luteimonas kalidii]MDH5834891.1 DUF3887 domain-containing protein [Luteimonas kalidii]
MPFHRSIALVLGLALSWAVSAPALCQEPPTEADAGAVALATDVLDRMDAGDFEGVATTFNAQMQAALDPAKLADVQRQLDAAGSVSSRSEPLVVRQDGYTVVIFRIEREQVDLDATVAIDGDGKVGGLHFVPAGGGPQ